MTSMPDIELVTKIQTGDSGAETELFTQFGSRIARKVSYQLGYTNPDWQDLAADIQIALLVSLREGRYRPERGVSLGAYVYGITNNKLKDYYKSRKKSMAAMDHTLVEIPFHAGIDYEIERKEQNEQLRKLLKRLSYKYKEILYMKYFKELSVSEISDSLNLPPRRVSERLNYALKLLRKECSKEKFSIFSGILLITI